MSEGLCKLPEGCRITSIKPAGDNLDNYTHVTYSLGWLNEPLEWILQRRARENQIVINIIWDMMLLDDIMKGKGYVIPHGAH